MSPSRWAQRRERAAQLGADHAPATGLLSFYQELVVLQEPLYAKARRSNWHTLAAGGERADGPRLSFERLAPELPLRAFERFVCDAAQISTDVLKTAAARLSVSHAHLRNGLERFLSRGAVPEPAADPADFFSRAFVSPVAEALVEGAATRYRSEPDCPECGWSPGFAILRDTPATKGQRRLVCMLCAAEWVFPRTRCVGCGERRPDKLEHHSAESWPHIRIDRCLTCESYLKTIDLRVTGTAVPVVDELASVELDVWADAQGWTKIARNLLGL